MPDHQPLPGTVRTALPQQTLDDELPEEVAP